MRRTGGATRAVCRCPAARARACVHAHVHTHRRTLSKTVSVRCCGGSSSTRKGRKAHPRAHSQAKLSERDAAMVAAEQRHLDSMGHVRKQLEDVSSDLTAAQASEARLAQQVGRCECIWVVVYHAHRFTCAGARVEAKEACPCMVCVVRIAHSRGDHAHEHTYIQSATRSPITSTAKNLRTDVHTRTYGMRAGWNRI
jgi:hypothetical protein